MSGLGTHSVQKQPGRLFTQLLHEVVNIPAFQNLLQFFGQYRGHLTD